MRRRGLSGGVISSRIASNTTLKLLVIPALHLLEAQRQVAMRCEYLPQLDEGAHDGDVYLNRAGAAQDAGEHGHALLGEGKGSGASPPELEVTFCDFKFAYSTGVS